MLANLADDVRGLENECQPVTAHNLTDQIEQQLKERRGEERRGVSECVSE